MTERSEMRTILRGEEIPPYLRMGLRIALGNSVASVYRNGMDVPVGAALIGDTTDESEDESGDGHMVVAHGYAMDKLLDNPLLHAEAVAVRNAKERPFHTLVCTLAPCVQCQDFLAEVPGLKTVAFGLPRREGSDRDLMKYHEDTEAERVRALGYPYEVIELDDPSLRPIGRSILDSVSRTVDLSTGEATITVDPVKMITSLVALDQLGHRL